MKNIATGLAAVAIFSLIPVQGLMTWTGCNVDKGEDFEVTDYTITRETERDGLPILTGRETCIKAALTSSVPDREKIYRAN